MAVDEGADITVGQIACIIFYVPVLILWLYSEYLQILARRGALQARRPSTDDLEESAPLTGSPKSSPGKKLADEEPQDHADLAPRRVLVNLVCCDQATLLRSTSVLRAMAEFGGLMLLFYVCERTSSIPSGPKTYSRDFFIALYLVLVLVSLGLSLHKTKQASILSGKSTGLLNRDQTEEWKGWMQVQFLLYHYFEAAELYNAIRVYIAGYVWMTGFGNFSYYYIKKDFSVGRFCQMMWRLNFLVFFVCMVLDNEYMLYYICPMHTAFTLLVFAALALGSKYNYTHLGIFLKLAALLGLVYVIWDLPGVFEKLFGPLDFLVGYTDPRRPQIPRLHEWHFRSGLDRYVWIFGMLCAYAHPYVEAALRWAEGLTRPRTAMVRSAVIVGVAAMLAAWYQGVYVLPKLEYNALHPYTSWIPLTGYILLRNLTPSMRMYANATFGWLGKITLETYIAQFHLWMHTGAPNAQPKSLLVYVPGYPMVTFVIATCVYILISYRLFKLTDVLKTAFVPHDDNHRLASNAVIGLLLATACGLLGILVRSMFLGV
eukprot:jgi/Mesvir1/10281/Mv07825-RA.1